MKKCICEKLNPKIKASQTVSNILLCLMFLRKLKFIVGKILVPRLLNENSLITKVFQ